MRRAASIIMVAPMAIIGGSGGGVPRIQVPAEHHDFIGLVGAGDVGDHVVGGLALRVDVVDDVELQADVSPSLSRRSMRP